MNLNDLEQIIRTLALDITRKLQKLETLQKEKVEECYKTDQKMLRNLQECVKSSATIVSSATSIISARQSERFSTICESNFGDCFPQDNEVVVNWMAESRVYRMESLTVPQAPPSVVLDELPNSTETDREADETSDSDLDEILVRALSKRGNDQMQRGEYGQAERSFRKCLEKLANSPRRRGLEAFHIRELLIDSLTRQEKFPEAAIELQKRLATYRKPLNQPQDQKSLDDLELLMITLTNAAKYSEAQLYGRRLLAGYRKLGAEGEPGVERTLRGLVSVCELQGSAEEQEEYSSMLDMLLEDAAKVAPDQSHARGSPTMVGPALTTDGATYLDLGPQQTYNLAPAHRRISFEDEESLILVVCPPHEVAEEGDGFEEAVESLTSDREQELWRRIREQVSSAGSSDPLQHLAPESQQTAQDHAQAESTPTISPAKELDAMKNLDTVQGLDAMKELDTMKEVCHLPDAQRDVGPMAGAVSSMAFLPTIPELSQEKTTTTPTDSATKITIVRGMHPIIVNIDGQSSQRSNSSSTLTSTTSLGTALTTPSMATLNSISDEEATSIGPAALLSPTSHEPHESRRMLLDPSTDFHKVDDRTQATPLNKTALRRKLLCLGDPMCGKNSLLNRYTKGSFSKSTDMTIFHNNYTCITSIAGWQVEFAVYDTNGLDEYAHTRALSYPGTDVVLLCFAINEPHALSNFEEKWLPEIQRHLDGIPLILVGTFSDLGGQHSDKVTDLISSVQAKKFATKIGALEYFETSAKTGERVKAAFDFAAVQMIIRSRKSAQKRNFNRLMKRSMHHLSTRVVS